MKNNVSEKQSKSNPVEVTDTKTAELKAASHVILRTQLHLRRQTRVIPSSTYV